MYRAQHMYNVYTHTRYIQVHGKYVFFHILSQRVIFIKAIHHNLRKLIEKLNFLREHDTLVAHKF